MTVDRVRQAPERNLALELVRVTEAAALAAARWQGRGDVDGAVDAATNAMNVLLNTVQMDGVVVIGQGEKGERDDRASSSDGPTLYNGKRVGTGEAPQSDVAVEPVEGTMLVAQGRPDAVSAIAISERGTMFDPGPCVYMEKIVVSPVAAGVIDIDRSPADNVRAVAQRKGENVHDVEVIILDRPRHHDLIAEIRKIGARIRLIQDGDVAGALSAAFPTGGADMLYGVGGTAEGVISAAAVKCTGGEMQARLWPRNADERSLAVGAGYDLELVMTADDLVQSDNCFFAATGITDGNLLKGVHYSRFFATTHSLVMRSKSGTVRVVEANHRLERLASFSEVDYE